MTPAGPSTLFESSAELHELFAALALCQAQLRVVVADEEAKIKSDKGSYSYKYADLAAAWDVARGPLAANGLALLQIPSAEGNRVTVRTVLGHKSGQWMAGTLSMAAANGTPQSVGSAITYARRYAMGAFLGLCVEKDDDGQAAQPRPGEVAVAPPRREPPASANGQAAAPAPAAAPELLERVRKNEEWLRQQGACPDGGLLAAVLRECGEASLGRVAPDAAVKAVGHCCRAAMTSACSDRMAACRVADLAAALRLAGMDPALSWATMTYQQLAQLLGRLREEPARAA